MPLEALPSLYQYRDGAITIKSFEMGGVSVYYPELSFLGGDGFQLTTASQHAAEGGYRTGN